ncbi:hypothetical protein ACQ4LE_005338 [Meloidogyne hapla]
MSITLFFEIISAVIYVIIWVILRHGLRNNFATRRLFKSLLSILLVSLLGFTLYTNYYLFTKIIGIPNFWDPKETAITYIAYQLANYFALIACCANTVILFKFSSEYRRAFLRYFPILKRFVKDLNNKNGINQFKPIQQKIVSKIRVGAANDLIKNEFINNGNSKIVFKRNNSDP